MDCLNLTHPPLYVDSLLQDQFAIYLPTRKNIKCNQIINFNDDSDIQLPSLFDFHCLLDLGACLKATEYLHLVTSHYANRYQQYQLGVRHSLARIN